MKRRGFLGTLFGGLAVALGLKAAEPAYAGFVPDRWADLSPGLRKGDVITVQGTWDDFPAELPPGRYVIEADGPPSDAHGLRAMRSIQSFDADLLMWTPIK